MLLRYKALQIFLANIFLGHKCGLPCVISTGSSLICNVEHKKDHSTYQQDIDVKKVLKYRF